MCERNNGSIYIDTTLSNRRIFVVVEKRSDTKDDGVGIKSSEERLSENDSLIQYFDCDVYDHAFDLLIDDQIASLMEDCDDGDVWGGERTS